MAGCCSGRCSRRSACCLLTEPWQGDVDLLGVGFALGAACCWASYILLTQAVGDEVAGLHGLAISLPVAGLVATLVAGPGTFSSLTWEILLVGLGLAVLLPVVPFSLEMLALRRLTTSAFGTLMSLEPAIALAIGLRGASPAARAGGPWSASGSWWRPAWARSGPAPAPTWSPARLTTYVAACPSREAPQLGVTVSARFEELDWRETPMGEISLRRRREPTLDVDVYEVRLGEEYLMSSLFTVAEIELSRLGLAAHRGVGLDVVVGGLGLGYTAVAALEDPRVDALTVVEALPEVVDWHERRLLPVADELVSDVRTRLVTADFFTTVGAGRPLPDDNPRRAFDVVLLDIDHSPRHVLHLEPRGLLQRGGPSEATQTDQAGRSLRAVVRRPARPRLRGPPGGGVRHRRGARRAVRELPHRRHVGQHGVRRCAVAIRGARTAATR